MAREAPGHASGGVVEFRGAGTCGARQPSEAGELRRIAVTLAVLALAVAGVAACAEPALEVSMSDQSAQPGENLLVPAGYDGRYRATFTVLENLQHGPQLCQTVGDSDPPTCEGPDVLGWAWTGLDATSRRGTTYGGFVVTGTWDGARFTLTEAPRRAGDADRRIDDTAQSQPGTECAIPEDGWPAEPWAAAADPRLAQDQLLYDTEQAARAVAGYGGMWLDRQPDVAIVNISTTGDSTSMTDAVRAVYSGPLCVSRAALAETTLLQMQDDLAGEPNVLYSLPDPVTGTLKVVAMAATTEFQQQCDAEFGPGAVVLIGLLEPIDER